MIAMSDGQTPRASLAFMALLAGAVAIFAIGLPNKLGLIVAMMLGIVAGMVAEKWNLRS